MSQQQGITLPLPTPSGSTPGASHAPSPAPSTSATKKAKPRTPSKTTGVKRKSSISAATFRSGSTTAQTPGAEREASAGVAMGTPGGMWAGASRTPGALGPPRAGTDAPTPGGNWQGGGASAMAGPSNFTTIAAATTAAAAGGTRGRKPYTHQGQFTKDIARLMYAFGDVENPNAASVSLLEEMTVDFITDLCLRARPSPYAVPVNVHPSPHVPATFAADGTFQGEEERYQAAGSGFVNLASSSAAGSGAGATEDDDTYVLQPKPSHPFATRAKVKMEDFKMALRKDRKKLARLEELLYLDRVISEARRGFEVPMNEDDVGGSGAREPTRAEGRTAAQTTKAAGAGE